jgi:hypothetical protein
MDRQGISGTNHVGRERKEIYPHLVMHQCNEQWGGRDLLNWLHEWAVRFNVDFNLNVPHITLGVEVLRSDIGAHFRYGHNAFGLQGEIILNAVYLEEPQWWLLGVLLHELLHGWQQAHGTVDKKHANYHNHEYRAKAKELGLTVDRYGKQYYESDSVFFDLIREHGVEVPELAVAADEEGQSRKKHVVRPRPVLNRGNSNLKKWSCGCTNVRVAVVDFQAQCLKCGNVFVRQ